ncbi:hypothetical protein [Leptospira haakeii]|uniref:WG repeat-containing protein n=1 Tax=Leptospira haakeii TaxID=2023198 RepID=A0ABX4PME9_9LEPT|nr:hypothetical protein [Leptospira haakeii]PKA16810.1 hypothetical protein CH363_05265 [Leptospira haakeii]PKA19299.1 hypothetical protein CH377_13335 [Leptospira haakeii]
MTRGIILFFLFIGFLSAEDQIPSLMPVPVGGNFCRYIDEEGEFKLKTYYRCTDFESDLAVVYNRDYSYALIDKNGKEIRKLPSGYEYIGVKNGKIKIRKGWLFGILNIDGSVFIKPEYFSLGYEYDGRIAYCIKQFRNCGYLDSNGRKKIGGDFFGVNDFKNGAAKIIVDENRAEIINPEGQKILPAGTEAPCGVGEGFFPLISSSNKEIRYYSLDGKWKDLPSGIRLVSVFSEGYSFFFKDKSFGVLDEKFEIVWEKPFPELNKLFIYEHTPVTDIDRQYSICYSPYQYRSGFALVSRKEPQYQMEFLDPKGNPLGSIGFTNAENFRGNFAKVEIARNQIGILNRSGKIIYTYLKIN